MDAFSAILRYRMYMSLIAATFLPFATQVMKNLHVVFTMNPSEDGLKDKAATSPALFNRCVLNWFGDWGLSALFQVGREFTLKMDLERPAWKQPDFLHFKVSVSYSSWEFRRCTKCTLKVYSKMITLAMGGKKRVAQKKILRRELR